MPSLINAEMLDTSPPEWTVEGFLPRVGLGILHGPSYYGKSLVTDNELSLAIANGTEFFGMKTVQGNVVVALGEGLYDAGVRQEGRLARQQQDNEIMLAAIEDGEEREKARAELQPYTTERLFIQTQPFAVPVRPDGQPSDSLKHAIAQLRIIPDLELLVLDAMSDFSGGLSISNDTSANRFILGLKMLVKELDCVVVVVNHQTADGKKMIGAQRLYNACDFVIEVVPDDTGPGEPKSATLVCRKSKYGPEFSPVSYLIEPIMWTTETEDGPVTVSTATVRRQGDELAEGTATLRLPGNGPAPHRELPEISPVPRSRKRNGIRTREPSIPPGELARRWLTAHPKPGMNPELTVEALTRQWQNEHPEPAAEPETEPTGLPAGWIMTTAEEAEEENKPALAWRRASDLAMPPVVFIAPHEENT